MNGDIYTYTDYKDEKKDVEKVIKPITKKQGQEFMQFRRQGGLVENPGFIVTATGFVTVKRIYRFNEEFNLYWLTPLAYIPNVQMTIDIEPEDKQTIKNATDSTITRAEQQYKRARTSSSESDAISKIGEAKETYKEFQQGTEGANSFTIRLVLFGKTLDELKRVEARVEKELLTLNLESTIALNDIGSEINLTKFNNAVDTISTASTLAASFPFYFQEHIDESGIPLGKSVTGGNIIIDFTCNDKTTKRISYDMVIVGKKGSGKSATMKRIIKGDFLNGHKQIIIDPENEYSKTVEYLGGRVIKINGKNSSVINPLEFRNGGSAFFSEGEEKIDLEDHLQNVCSFISIFNDELSTKIKNDIVKFLRAMYKDDYGIDDKTNTLNFKPEDFPIFEDFYNYIVEYRRVFWDKLTIFEQEEIELMISAVENIVSSFGKYFNKHSNIIIGDEELISFNLREVTMSNNDKLLQGVMFNILNVFVTSEMNKNKLYNDNRKDFEERKLFRVIIEEAHLILNEQNTKIVEYINKCMKLFRKYTSSLALVSQSILDYLKPGTSNVSTQLRQIYEESMYKMIFLQDALSIGRFKEEFKELLAESDFKKMQDLDVGEYILALNQDMKLYGKVMLTPNEIELFSSENIKEGKNV